MKKQPSFLLSPTRREFLKTASLTPAVASLASLTPGVAAADGYPDLAALRAAHAKQGIIPPNRTYRMMEWEFHTPPEVDFRIDWDGAMKAARDAGAESMMF